MSGSQLAASLASRVWDGNFSDNHGAKQAVMAGLLTAAIGGLFYLLSLRLIEAPIPSISILLVGRAFLGTAESFIITGGVSWGLAVVRPSHAGRVIAWVGMAMFAARAVGAPLGTILCGKVGFVGVAAATALIPLTTIVIVLPLRMVPRGGGRHPGILRVGRTIWSPGLGAGTQQHRVWRHDCLQLAACNTSPTGSCLA